MNGHERILYYLFKKTKGIKLGTRHAGLTKADKNTFSKTDGPRIDSRWELRDLYFDLGVEKDDTPTDTATL